MRTLWRVSLLMAVLGSLVGGWDWWLAAHYTWRTGWYPSGAIFLWLYPPAWYLIVSLIPAMWVCWKED